MSYTSKSLSVLGYTNGFTLWHYATPDAATAVGGAGYFNAAAEMLRVGDFILANTGQGGMPQHGIFVVAANAHGQVDLADLTPAGSNQPTAAAA